MDEVDSYLEDDINNLMNDSDTEFVMEESLGNELYSDEGSLNLLVPEASYHVAQNPAINKTLEEGSNKAEEEVKGKGQKKRQK